VLVISSGSRVAVVYFAHLAISADYSGMWRLGVGLDDFACQCFSSLSVLLGRQRVHRVAALTCNTKGRQRLPMPPCWQGEWIVSSGSRHAEGKLEIARSGSVVHVPATIRVP